MDYIRFAITNPVKVTVAVLLLLLFGLIALFTIPVQLTPNVDQPIITVETNWTGRSPEEVERSIVEEQEDKIKGVTNLKKMTATSSLGRAQITLEFYIGTNMTRVLQEVSDKLREVPEYPEDVDQPVITASEASEERAIAWMVLVSEEPGFDVASIFEEADKRLKPYLERVEGVSQVNIYGGRKREVHIQVDPKRVAERGITFNQLRQALRLENLNISAGNLPSGRLDLRVRTIGQYEDLESVRNTIVADTAGGPVRVRDVATVVLTLEKERAFVKTNGKPAMAINVIRETGANVMTVMAEVRQRIEEINRTILPSMGPKLKLEQVYDETIYISDSLALVTDNLWQGGALVVLVLLFFLRHVRSPALVGLAAVVLTFSAATAFAAPEGWVKTLALAGVGLAMLVIVLDSPPTMIIGLAIPLSVIGTFVAMTAFGRNLNVVSLAGLAFAVGMVVDNAVVVLENIDRHLGMGKTAMRAAYEATREVWLAMMASTATTLVVFIPVLTLQEEAGQLFRDISLAVCASVGLSLIVAVTVIPAAAARWLGHKPKAKAKEAAARGLRFETLWGIAPLLGNVVNLTAATVYAATGSLVVRVVVVAVFTAASMIGSWLLMPPTTYLPSGNRNLVFGVMLTPPGYNIAQNRSIGERVEAGLQPYWEAKSFEDTAKVPPLVDMSTGQVVEGPRPWIDHYFFVSFGGQIFMGAASGSKEIVQPLEPLMTGAMMQIPGAFGFAKQISLFGRGLGGSNSLDVEISGDDLTTVRASTEAIYQTLMARYGQMNVIPGPMNFNMAAPEYQVTIDRVQAADLGIDVASLGLGVQALVDGSVVGDYRYQGDSIDLVMVRDPKLELTPETLGDVPVAVNPAYGGGTVPLSSVARLRHTEAPQEIKRIEQRRAISLAVTPPTDVPLEQATTDIQKMIEPLRASGQVSPDVEITMAGTADKLIQVRESFLGPWHGWTIKSLESLIMSRMFLALLINYLVMAWLFDSFLYPFVIMFTVPLATVGGFLGLRVTHTFVPTQLLDVVTMLGFVILIGTAVNNSILLVAQALNFMQGFGESPEDRLEKAMTPREAIRESVRTRMRPVMMTTTTTLLGMSPLVVKPGAGSELYRGLGSVVLGGLAVSTVFTLLVTPLVFSLVLDVKIWAYRRMGWPIKELNELEELPGATAAAGVKG
ncbi:MAG: efflux RND transporter permease subunit [Phycisphaeraceae bacterium]|nr:efflux RND transporter permease subunit [Phycisphaeraceae bacterium]